MSGPLGRRLAAGKTLLLDGALGTELQRQGRPLPSPLWSAAALLDCPDAVRSIHLAYARAGADILTTNTFRTTRRMIERAGVPIDVVALNDLAVALAREARASARPAALVAGSIAPLEDCYAPSLAPPFAAALAEHREQASRLAAAGVDFLLIETMPSVAEAEAAAIAAAETGLEVAVSFVLGEDGRLLSGEPLSDAVSRVAPQGVTALLINCAPPPVIDRGLEALRALTRLPIGGYANACVLDPRAGWVSDGSLTGAAYAAIARGWITRGARIVGGCCGTRPDQIAALRRLLDERGEARQGMGAR